MGNRISVLTTEIIRVFFCGGEEPRRQEARALGMEGPEPAPDPDLGTS
jgi:hypothetical protein